ncbi:hypothetical protein ACS0TY_006861 [Phlomoides rotata]
MDAASGGEIVNKTPREARDLITTMTANSQQFGIRQNTSNKRVNEVTISSLDDRITNFSSLVQNFAAGKMQQV